MAGLNDKAREILDGLLSNGFPGYPSPAQIYLPCAEEEKPLSERPHSDSSKASAPGSEVVLLVEDETGVRELAREYLQMNGYKVIEAPDGATALSIYRQHQKEIDLVVADMVMPCMSGPELFERMKEINPGVRVIVSSGYSQDQEGRRMLRHGCLGYLQKPYNLESLDHLVRNVLDSGL